MSPNEQILKFAPTRPAPLTARAMELDPVASKLLGNSLAITQLRAQVRRVAPYFRSLSLTGEPGCGEDAVAHSLHQLSPRHEHSFVTLSAAEVEEHFRPESMQAEVASYHPKDGLLYLPEAERLSKAAQEGLLRMLRLQVGQSTRVVAFAGRGLKPYMSAGYFLPELAACLGSLRMALPALRERAEDVPLLIHCYLQQLRTAQALRGVRVRTLHLSENFLEAAMRFAWPGNLPQLHSVLQWLLDNRSDKGLDIADLSAAIEAGGHSAETRSASTRLIKLDRVMQEHVRAVLLACNGNKLKAAEVLGISRSTLYRMLEAGEGVDLLMAG